jgi:hypothetical protein
LIREALALAGGVTGMRGTPGVLTPTGSAPIGGVATGEIVTDTIRESGYTIEAYRWVYGPGRRATFRPHMRLDGTLFTNFDDPALINGSTWPPNQFFYPGDHRGCVVAGTEVSGPTPHGVTLRHYEGEVVTIRCADGEHLTVTPNHPVLTRHGWVPAGSLGEGDEVVRSVPVDPASGLVPDDHEVPARVEDVAAAFSVAAGVVAYGVPVASVDFHGDGADGQVCVVWADRELVDRLDPTLREETGDDAFTLPYTDALVVTRDGGAGERVSRVRPSSLRGVSSSGHRSTLVWGSPGGGDELRVAAAAWLDTDRAKTSDDDVAVDVVAACERQDRLPAGMELGKVLSVERTSLFSGHVYNLSTGPAWYYANGILVHNCLCDFEPVLIEGDAVASVIEPGIVPATEGGQ